MEFHLLTLTQLQGQRNEAELESYNRRSAPFGLVLSEQAMERLCRQRGEALRESGRIEFGEPVLGKLIAAFSSSPYLIQSEYEETLTELQTLFYYFKSECRDLLSDDELVEGMRLIYDEAAGGSTAFLSEVDWETMYQAAVSGSLAGTELVRPPLAGFFEGGDDGEAT